MSGYLMRLVMRGRAAGEARPLQPFVRSTSPIAERDQRIGMMDFEGVELGEASPAEAGLEAGSEQAGVLQPPTLPTITATSDIGVATAQRKMASPPAGPATPNAREVAAAVEAQRQSNIQPPGSRAVRSVAPAPSRTRSVSNRAMQLASSHSEVGALDLVDAHDVPVSPSGPPMVSPEKSVVADVEWSVSSTGRIRSEALSLGDSQTENAPRQFGPGAVHTRSIRQTRQVDSTRLEPSPQAFPERFDPQPMDARVSTNEVEAPRVIIGRINVEVVPPSAAPPSTAAPRSGPLTAASASVIGPLGGGIRPNLCLSLRHR